jgi:glycosyltransferase involved in cell wall biosynthesis
MASGCACITSDNAGGKAQIEDGITGLIVPKHDRAALREAINELLDNSVLCRQLGERAREHTMTEHSLNAMALRFEGAYRRAIDG